jgi:hypothetical protein
MAQHDGWEDVSHELTQPKNNNGWEDVSHELEPKDSGLMNKLETAARGYGDSALIGYRDNIDAAIEPATAALYNMFQDDDKKIDVDPSYVNRRDAENKRTEKLKEENPKSYYGGMIGGAVSTAMLPGLNAAKGASAGARILSAAKTGAAMGALANPGETEGELSDLQLGDRTKNAVVGGLMGGGLQTAGEGASYVAKKAPELLNKLAEKSAVNATGATGKQAANFSDDAGRELLDRGIVKFGDSQNKIAERASGAVDAANAKIDSALSQLEQNGVKVDANQIYDKVRAKISELKGDPSQADIAKMLESELDNVINATDAKGSTEFGIGEAEKIKRGYNRKAGNWADPEKGQVGKEMYQTFRNEVEGAAQNANPELAQMFKEGKESYGLLRPIEEAAERRASTTAQSPAGGLLDVASAAAGVATGNPVMAVASPIARRIISPRIASSVAVGSDVLANQLAKISPKFAEMSQKNPQAFSLMVQNLSQNPKFQEKSNVQQQAPVQDQASPLFERLSKDPKGMDVLKNDRLKEQYQKYQQKKNINKPVPIKEAQSSFIEGN